MSDTPEPTAVCSGADIDMDAFAEYLRDLADGIDDGSVLLTRADDSLTAPPATDPLEVSLSLEYGVPRDRANLARPLKVDVGDGD